MNEAPIVRESLLLGDEAVAFGALDAGISAAYAYPGTPSTEILETILGQKERTDLNATWTVNEKTAFEQALGASMAGRRALVVMKHVGLNVAADPFINSALVAIEGGLVLAVADDPGMHSSQNEQDSRFYADFAHVPCFEPADQQEAYDMTRDAFALSELHQIPVVLRLVTRLAHSRAAVKRSEPHPPNEMHKTDDPRSWVLLPGISRQRWRRLLDIQRDIRHWSEDSGYTQALNDDHSAPLGIITCGLARNYYFENMAELPEPLPHLHIGSYPFPTERIRRLAAKVDRLLVLEEGFPFVERFLRGVLDQPIEITGRLSGALPEDGELDPDKVRQALGLPARPKFEMPPIELPARPPQLCRGCPHGDAYSILKGLLSEYPSSLVTADIGCYTLGALPPYSAIESCVCMGASVGMAKGASEAGIHPVVAIIGDSTFLHSGVTPLIDAAAADTAMTLLILDNQVVAMTGGQITALPPNRLHEVVLGTGANPEHVHLVETHPTRLAEFRDILKREMDHQGLSVIIAVRECIEAARKTKKQAKEPQS
ncbi:MAG: indolepyruvate ferredoxin oxidoreductase [Planctomycetes bacterium]|nr:indolepyruvate ferredoxin oxidoreductase [Planctomycetota bacterium]